MQDDEQAATHTPGIRTRRRLSRASIVTLLICVALLAGILYAGRVAWLSMMATEGDVPPISAVPLPEGSEVLGDTKGCGSGGCTSSVTIRPPEGMSPEHLVELLGATPQAQFPGNLWDPRTVWVSARPAGSMLLLSLDYWSGEYVP